MPIPIIKISQGTSILGPQAPSDVGDIIEYGGSAPPAGWLLCQGQALSTTTYPQLFAALGYTYGGSGTTFYLPNANVTTPVLYNAIRNPEMIVAQRGTSGSMPVNTGGYTLDGWVLNNSGLMVTAWSRINAAIPADTSGNNWYPYIPYAYRLTISTGSGALAAGNYLYFFQNIEGLMAESLKSNPTSISFLVRSSITGTFCVSLGDFTSTHLILYPVTITSANIWQRVTIPNIPTFTASGTFPDGTVGCYYLLIALAAGSTWATATTSSWISGNYVGTTTQTNFAATIGTTFDITAVQHEPNPTCNPYIRRELEAEIALNYRYFVSYAGGGGGGVWLGEAYTAGFPAAPNISFPVPMRAIPTIASGASFTLSAGNAGTPVAGQSTVSNIGVYNGGTAWTVGATIVFNGGFTAEL